ncbi:KAT8 regulatory NSL complex subunit 1-like isoform X4 [Aquila chrysaetos chrysaetos]|uniref:KAT8 regulatory NSL complex subunit 1-like isoform X4 n=1 Tax=Aquila chrysaetos chrysaetos TaxID=223781 RepID=UPI0011769C70|nr:KAT8 regulatory NSL complex subunit 1-like isoform X4 [Aquila chrysaetos chrysaetos]
MAAVASGLCPPPTGRAAAARGRQAVLWSRARRLRHRLLALQARQVERHVRHQLAGLTRYLRRAGPAGGLPSAVGSDLRLLAASATARLRATQGACDSDATGSSSGSGEESEADGDGQRRPAAASPERRHAECQWAMERAAIICRWTWLQAQISDLEYRIRQQTDIYKRLRAAKGPVVLGGDRQPGDLMKKQGQLGSRSLVSSKKNKWLLPSSSIPRCPVEDAVPSHFLFNMQKKTSHLTQSLGKTMCQSPSCTPISGSSAPLRACVTSPRQVNRVFTCWCTGSSSSSSLISVNVAERFGKANPLNNLVSVLDNTCIAARIRPVCKYNKRKLVRATSVSHFSRKPLKPLTVKCSCEWPSSCILCSCKASVQTIDPDTMSLEERVALLDSGFHPILSLSHGNPLHLHFETLLREDGLPRLLSRELRTLKMSCFGKKQDPTNSTFPKLHSSLLDASPGAVFEGRRQLEGTSSRSFPVSSPQAHKYSSLYHAPSLHPETPPAPSSSQIPFTGSPAVQSSKSRKAERSYDIDDIVIPMSMAAATRVEKPQYKEIVVPSWRIVELEELEPFNQADSELEDTSDKMYSRHHSKYEDLERACWDSWAAATYHKRGSSQTRMVLSCSEGTRSSLEMLDEAVQNVQPWEPRTFPLSDSAYRGLLQHSNEDGYDQADFQPWVSSNKQGIRPTSVDTVIPSFTGMQFSVTHLQTHGNKSHREVHGPALQPRKAWQQH